MVSAGGCHTVLVPPLAFSGGVSETVQHGCNLIVAVAKRHAPDDFERLHGCGGLGSRARPIHLKSSMRTAFPMDDEPEGLVFGVSLHDDLFDRRAEDHLFECRRTAITLPQVSKVIAHRTNSYFLFGRHRISRSI